MGKIPGLLLHFGGKATKICFIPRKKEASAVDRRALAAAFPVTLPVLMGYLSIGIAFGLMLQGIGYNFIWAFFMSLTIYAGSGQYLAVTLLALFNIIQICFPHLFFRLSLLGRVRNIDDAEPSDFYIAMEQIEWVVLALACLLFYYMAMTTIQ